MRTKILDIESINPDSEKGQVERGFNESKESRKERRQKVKKKMKTVELSNVMIKHIFKRQII